MEEIGWDRVRQAERPSFWICRLLLMAIAASALLVTEVKSSDQMRAKDIFAREVATGQPGQMAASFILQFVEGNQKRRVSLNHAFKTGDEVDLVITSSREAYLFIVNINPKGVPHHVWPTESQRCTGQNRMTKGVEMLVPVVFGGSAGAEWLLVILSPVDKLPNLDRIQLELDTYQKAPGRVVEYTDIHSKPRQFGAKGTFGSTDEPTSHDPTTYGAQISDDTRAIVYPYLLRHQAAGNAIH